MPLNYQLASSYAAAAALIDAAGQTLKFVQSPGANLFPVTPTQNVLFSDNFNGSVIDTVNRWQPAVLVGGTMTQANGSLVAATSTTASNAASITSQEFFEPNVGNLTAGMLAGIEAAPGTNTNRCVGLYTKPGSFTAATPVQDGYVWEYDITGAFGASIYNAGVRTSRTTVNPTTGQPFFTAGQTLVPLSVVSQGLSVNFYINDFILPALTVPNLQASTMYLPFGFHCINHTSGPGVAPTWSLQAVAVLDGSGASQTIWNGQAFSRLRTPNVMKSVNGVVVTSAAALWTPAAGRRFRLMGGMLSAGVATGNIQFLDAAANMPFILPMPAIGVPQPFTLPGNGILSSAAGNILNALGASTQTLTGWVHGTEE